MTETTAKSSVGLLNSFSGRKGASCLTAAHTTKHGMGRKTSMNTKTITPIHVCDLIAHETVSLLSVLDEDAVPR